MATLSTSNHILYSLSHTATLPPWLSGLSTQHPPFWRQPCFPILVCSAQHLSFSKSLGPNWGWSIPDGDTAGSGQRHTDASANARQHRPLPLRRSWPSTPLQLASSPAAPFPTPCSLQAGATRCSSSRSRPPPPAAAPRFGWCLRAACGGGKQRDVGRSLASGSRPLHHHSGSTEGGLYPNAPVPNVCLCPQAPAYPPPAMQGRSLSATAGGAPEVGAILPGRGPAPWW